MERRKNVKLAFDLHESYTLDSIYYRLMVTGDWWNWWNVFAHCLPAFIYFWQSLDGPETKKSIGDRYFWNALKSTFVCVITQKIFLFFSFHTAWLFCIVYPSSSSSSLFFFFSLPATVAADYTCFFFFSFFFSSCCKNCFFLPRALVHSTYSSIHTRHTTMQVALEREKTFNIIIIKSGVYCECRERARKRERKKMRAERHENYCLRIKYVCLCV